MHGDARVLPVDPVLGQSELESAVDRLMSAIPGVTERLCRCRSVFVKPNLGGGTPASHSDAGCASGSESVALRRSRLETPLWLAARVL